MRVEYQPGSTENWAEFFQTGDGFHGMQFQRGAGLGAIFRSIFRTLMPLAKSAGKAIGRQALETGASIASDVVAGESARESVEKHGRTGAANLLRKAAKRMEGGRLKKGIKRRKVEDYLS